jgi:hypothetical protein
MNILGKKSWFLLLLFLIPRKVLGDCPPNATCVPSEDIKVFVNLLEDKKCQQSIKPDFKLDPINIVLDKDGRVYYSGNEPYPYTIKMAWCNYEVVAKGQVNLMAAVLVPPSWGFRFRPKFSSSILFVDAFDRSSAGEAIDVGIFWEFLYWKSLNLNVTTGFRSIGLGIGLDITKNFGVQGGYAFSWWTLKHNPQLGLGFAFW